MNHLRDFFASLAPSRDAMALICWMWALLAVLCCIADELPLASILILGAIVGRALIDREDGMEGNIR